MNAIEDVSFLVFDVESIADGELIGKVRYPQEALSPEAAVERYRNELMDRWGSEFIPYTYHIPVSVTIGKVSPGLELLEIKSLDTPQFQPHEIVKKFWKGWEIYRQPTLVTFNGRTFDIPLLELAAFRYGINISEWLGEKKMSYEKPRNRFNQHSHLDLQEVLTNFAATRFNGGLNLAATMLGKPGKMGVAGHMVQELYENGKLNSINDYCCCDVLDTYFVFLRYKVINGELTLEREQEIVAKTLEMLQAESETNKAYQEYLDCCSQWQNPWTKSAEEVPMSAESDETGAPSLQAELPPAHDLLQPTEAASKAPPAQPTDRSSDTPKELDVVNRSDDAQGPEAGPSSELESSRT